MNKTIALVAHDNRKLDLAEWVSFNAGSLIPNKMVCTGTTGKKIEKILKENNKNRKIKIWSAWGRSTIGRNDC